MSTGKEQRAKVGACYQSLPKQQLVEYVKYQLQQRDTKKKSPVLEKILPGCTERILSVLNYSICSIFV